MALVPQVLSTLGFSGATVILGVIVAGIGDGSSQAVWAIVFLSVLNLLALFMEEIFAGRRQRYRYEKRLKEQEYRLERIRLEIDKELNLAQRSTLSDRGEISADDRPTLTEYAGPAEVRVQSDLLMILAHIGAEQVRTQGLQELYDRHLDEIFDRESEEWLNAGQATAALLWQDEAE